MKLPIALGIAAAALTVAAASAQSTSSRHVMIRHGGMSDVNIDANEDGWIARAEAAAAYERIFADLDTNDDGKLDGADRREIHINAPDVHVLDGDRDGHERHVRVITGDIDEETEARIEREVEEAMSRVEVHVERAERDAERAEREAERAEQDAERAERRIERHVHDDDGTDGRIEREVIVIRHGGGEWTSMDGHVAPVPPVPPVSPMPFMMLIANSEEADRDGDGALTREEFVAQHLRFFDASDANGDGRIRFDPPAPPPEPPAPPAPPEPPRRR